LISAVKLNCHRCKDAYLLVDVPLITVEDIRLANISIQAVHEMSEQAAVRKLHDVEHELALADFEIGIDCD